MLRAEKRWLFAAIPSRPRDGFIAQKIAINKSITYMIGENARLNSRAVKDYDDNVRGFITKEGRRNRELINAW
ncbi:hypothetical protein EOA27_26765 [Mesorhizobium sp. M2A.F.Ca.ET.037.01.1.1]|uniref:hypothetical protein n=1 Tax=unclassified Mesorhizobium TaxID=325217 RepID=UPI000FCC2B99|nr:MULTISPECIES: hypothetical protein [unclassified Mesorhizobium]RUY00328.1 hypothetical protein EOA25_24625 [Mesorhizobium sp. M2A.F.Ca.ET.040.01.1.1]RUX07489.1 hypothetical protein EOA27_26765 [Mesorhizobium sp. M2A.F.Ca.ET.037.01.1.1]RWA93118.1 MAG: hypothetical protein EOQ31_05310 [Mesorhizobium sp.]RWC16993.1 MAG: hypothetical protein EOS52_04685 [Mesorhizobium sp.]RWF21471.1 MAG: hypothetical protein EOS44_29535 [Mesorhizobium sp.]